MAPIRWASIAALVLLSSLAVFAGAVPAGAQVHAAAVFTCSGGTAAAPESIPAGTYSALTVTSTGTCAIGGAVTVTGDVTVDPGGAFADITSTTPLTVQGNVIIGSGAATFLGCEANFFPCADNANGTGIEHISGSLITNSALTAVTHQLVVGHNVEFLGGGGGVSCPNAGPGSGTVPGNTPAAALLNAQTTPPYFDNEDNTIKGNVWITNIQTCWIGSLRNTVGGSLVDQHNTMADPDAGEVLANHVGGNLICTNNSPVTQFGDSHSTSNVVGGAAVGECAFSVKQPNPAASPGPPPTPAGPLQAVSVQDPHPRGYVLGGGDGAVFAFGTPFFGSAPGTNELFNFSGIATAPGGLGYWIVNGSGHVVNFGPNAPFLGDTGGAVLAKPAVGIAASPWGDGYYTAGGDGGVFAFGPSTHFYGSTGGIKLVQPVTGIATTAAGNGYYEVARDGGVFAFGPGSRFQGSLGGVKLVGPIVGMTVDPVTGGYYLVGSDGGVFAFNAPFLGSLGGVKLAQPIVGIVAAPGGDGYYMVAKDGGVFAFGKGAHFQGSTGGIKLNQPVDGMALG